MAAASVDAVAAVVDQVVVVLVDPMGLRPRLLPIAKATLAVLPLASVVVVRRRRTDRAVVLRPMVRVDPAEVLKAVGF